MRFALIAGLLATALALSATGREPEPKGTRAVPPPPADRSPGNNPGDLAEEGIKRLKADGVAGLCDVAFAPGKTVNKTDDRVLAEAHFKRLYDAILARYGKSMGEFEFLRKEVAGASVVKFTYLEKLEKSPVVWKLMFYRVSGEWKWKDIGLTDSLEPEFRPER